MKWGHMRQGQWRLSFSSPDVNHVIILSGVSLDRFVNEICEDHSTDVIKDVCSRAWPNFIKVTTKSSVVAKKDRHASARSPVLWTHLRRNIMKYACMAHSVYIALRPIVYLPENSKTSIWRCKRTHAHMNGINCSIYVLFCVHRLHKLRRQSNRQRSVCPSVPLFLLYLLNWSLNLSFLCVCGSWL